MAMHDLSTYSKAELMDALRLLKSYRASLKQIGKRSVLVDSKKPKEKFFRVEYAPGVAQDFLEKFFQAVREKFFVETPDSTQVRYISNEKIIGGIRVFYGDDMIDFSFQDFIHALN